MKTALKHIYQKECLKALDAYVDAYCSGLTKYDDWNDMHCYFEEHYEGYRRMNSLVEDALYYIHGEKFYDVISADWFNEVVNYDVVHEKVKEYAEWYYYEISEHALEMAYYDPNVNY